METSLHISGNSGYATEGGGALRVALPLGRHCDKYIGGSLRDGELI